MSHEGTVARHGMRFRLNFLAGIPLEQDDGSVFLYEPEPLWREADLTPEQAAEMDAMVAKAMAERPVNDPVCVRWVLMDQEGIEHTHRQGKPIDHRRPARGYECPMCRSWIVNENPGDYPFVGGPADGRWYVTGGARRWRIPAPPETSMIASYLSDGSASDEGFRAVEYERVGDRYYPVR